MHSVHCSTQWPGTSWAARTRHVALVLEFSRGEYIAWNLEGISLQIIDAWHEEVSPTHEKWAEPLGDTGASTKEEIRGFFSTFGVDLTDEDRGLGCGLNHAEYRTALLDRHIRRHFCKDIHTFWGLQDYKRIYGNHNKAQDYCTNPELRAFGPHCF